MAQRISPFASLKPIEKDLNFVAGRAGDNGRSLLTNLGIKLVDIDSFQNHYGRTTKDACFKGLVHWLEGNVSDEPVTFGTLFQALRDSAMTGCISLLEERLKARSPLNRAEQDLSTQPNNVPLSSPEAVQREGKGEDGPSYSQSTTSAKLPNIISDEDEALYLRIEAALNPSAETPPAQQRSFADKWLDKDPPVRKLQTAFFRFKTLLAKLFDEHIDCLQPVLRFHQKLGEEWPYKGLKVEDIDNATTFEQIFNKIDIEDCWLNTDMLIRLIDALPDEKPKDKAKEHLETYHQLLGVVSYFVLLKHIPEDDARLEHIRSSLLPMSRWIHTYDENYESSTFSELLKQKNFLSKMFNIPKEYFHSKQLQ